MRINCSNKLIEANSTQMKNKEDQLVSDIPEILKNMYSLFYLLNKEAALAYKQEIAVDNAQFTNESLTTSFLILIGIIPINHILLAKLFRRFEKYSCPILTILLVDWTIEWTM